MKKILYITLAFAALFAVSCQKEKELHPVGSKIVFSASTEFRNGLETRTIYTGQYTQTSPNYERIQWEPNDPIKILYSHGSSTSANYAIDGTTIGGTGTAKKSTASINASGTALEWADGGSHVFYGIYPASAGTLTASSVTGLSIPATQTVTWNADQSKYLPTMTNAFMVAYKDMSSDPTGTVNLPFTPVVNAVEFRLHLPDDRPSYTVTQVQFSHGSTAIAGSYDVSITGFANDAVTWSASSNSTTKKILVNFSPANPAVPTSTSGNVLDFTILTLPVQISNPILEIKYSDGHVLKLTLSGLTLQPGQKCIVTNSKAGHDHFTYLVSGPASETITGHNAASFSQINVTSIKRSGADNTHTEPVAWKVQYYNNTQSDWFDTDDANYPLQGYTITKGTNTLDVSLAAANTVANQNFENGNPFQAATEILKARTSVGSSSDPYDLSTHALDGETIAQTAANCYVITRPGWYKFPLIYGNALLLGDDNPSAYSPKDVSAISSAWGSQGTDATQNYYLPAFYNAVGDVIDSPYILTDLGNIFGRSATVAGLNGSGSPSVHFDNNHGANDGIITNCSVVGSGSSAYIKFEVTEANIKPGNVRLLLEGSVVVSGQAIGVGVGDTYPVLWSWHIWVTDKDLTPSNSIMPYNLGWVDANATVNNSVKKYTNRTVTLQIVQVEGGSEVNSSDPFTLTQNGDAHSINNPLNGTNPHYQWGRKDPYAASSSTVPLTQHPDAGESLGYWYWRGIRIPEVMLRSQYSTTWMDGKAIPLYKVTSSISTYTIKSGSSYEKTGPFTAAQKTSLTGTSFNPSGTTWTERTTITSYTSVANSQNMQPVPAVDVVTMYNLGWFAQGTFVQVDAVNNYWGFYENQTITTTQYANLEAVRDNPNNFPGFTALGKACIAGLVNVFSANHSGTGQYDLTLNGQSFPRGPHNQGVYDTLTGSGVYSSTDFNTNTNYTYGYTTDSERKLGSILHNLWSAALYNETASVTKYKTVYDPCPAGFTVPTKATYATPSSFTGYPRTGMRVNSGGTSASTSVTDSGTKGYYWTDHSCNMSYNTGAKDAITSYTDYDKSYILETTSSSASVKKNIRASAASIRPMTDPRATSIAGHATPAQVAAQNPIEGVTMGSEL